MELCLTFMPFGQAPPSSTCSGPRLSNLVSPLILLIILQWQERVLQIFWNQLGFPKRFQKISKVSPNKLQQKEIARVESPYKVGQPYGENVCITTMHFRLKYFQRKAFNHKMSLLIVILQIQYYQNRICLTQLVGTKFEKSQSVGLLFEDILFRQPILSVRTSQNRMNIQNNFFFANSLLFPFLIIGSVANGFHIAKEQCSYVFLSFAVGYRIGGNFCINRFLMEILEVFSINQRDLNIQKIPACERFVEHLKAYRLMIVSQKAYSKRRIYSREKLDDFSQIQTFKLMILAISSVNDRQDKVVVHLDLQLLLSSKVCLSSSKWEKTSIYINGKILFRLLLIDPRTWGTFGILRLQIISRRYELNIRRQIAYFSFSMIWMVQFLLSSRMINVNFLSQHESRWGFGESHTCCLFSSSLYLLQIPFICTDHPTFCISFQVKLFYPITTYTSS